MYSYPLICGTLPLQYFIFSVAYFCITNQAADAHHIEYDITNIKRTKSQKLNDSHSCLGVPLPESIEARCKVENEGVVGAAPTGIIAY